MWSQISLDLSILTQLLRLLRWAGRIKQDITLWATTLGQGLAQELDYVQVCKLVRGDQGRGRRCPFGNKCVTGDNSECWRCMRMLACLWTLWGA